jgi:hypothetical protein
MQNVEQSLTGPVVFGSPHWWKFALGMSLLKET